MHAIRIENLSKQYRLGLTGTGTLSHDLKRWWYLVRGKEDPYLKIGETNDRSSKGNSKYIWALKDINLEVAKGDVLGIIGKNGAGKSTLLKILSKVTTPTTGCIFYKGRIGSLLEVGTGFHPELTGRENIFLNGAILGMRKNEITSKFDEIVNFSGCERYIDTPVKRYSSGMIVRLGFAVAAFLDPEILVVDEVLAVGDAEFQKKAIGKMKDVSQNEGRTVLFVSHNMAAVKALCKKGIILVNGKIVFEGSSQNAIETYLTNHIIPENIIEFDTLEEAPGNDNIRIKSFKVLPHFGQVLNMDSGIRFCLEFFNHKEGINLDVTFELLTKDDIMVFHNGTLVSQNQDSKTGLYYIEGHLPPLLLNSGNYKLNLIFGENQKFSLFTIEDILSFEIENTPTGKGSNMNKLPGIIYTDLNWKVSYN
jgi:lipopolysaccharide transport system ATP-binding protein